MGRQSSHLLGPPARRAHRGPGLGGASGIGRIGLIGRVRLLTAAVAVVIGLAAPMAAAAHPLGNFTINHYAGLTIGRDAVTLDVVLDMAEIPAFQSRQTMDTDGDGVISDGESTAWAAATCSTLGSSLQLARDGSAIVPSSSSEAISFPPGAGGLSTLRLECGFAARFASPITVPTTLSFADASYAERIGWREIVATGDGTILDTHGLPAASPSQRLTSYPADLIAQPLDIRSASITAIATPAGSGRANDGGAGGLAAAAGSIGGPTGQAIPVEAAAAVGAVPGGVGGELPGIFRTTDLTPFVVLASLVTAIVIGAGHALTPGHGKTLMAAYLVGSRGTAIHAVGLGLSVAVSHTLGIFVLAVLIVGAQGVLPPDVVVRTTPTIAAASIVAIGGWMLIGEVRRRRARRAVAGATARSGEAEVRDRVKGPEADCSHSADHPHQDEHDHRHAHLPSTVGNRFLRGPEHDHEPALRGDNDGVAANPPTDRPGAPVGEHSHGAVRHSHLPTAETTLSWRGLFVLGLAGGLIPSTSALLILLGSMAAGRPAFGLLLVVAFGLGMAAVMTGVGLAMILARSRLDRMPSRSSLGRLAAAAPLLASMAVLALGVVLTWQAVAGRPVL